MHWSAECLNCLKRSKGVIEWNRYTPTNSKIIFSKLKRSGLLSKWACLRNMVLQGTITKVDRREYAKIPAQTFEVSLLLCACVTLQIFFRFYYFTLFTKFKHYCTLFTETILIKIGKKRNQKRKCSVTNIFSFSHTGSEKFCSLFNHRRNISCLKKQYFRSNVLA